MRNHTLGALATGALAVLALLFAGFVLGELKEPSSYRCEQYSHALAALQAERNLTPGLKARDALDARIAEVTKQIDEDRACGGDDRIAATPTPSIESRAPSTPATTPSAAKSADKKQEWNPHYYFYDSGKTAERNFGPPVSRKDTWYEFKHRLKVDPSLACGNGGQILNNEDGGHSCIKKLLASTDARDAYLARVYNKIERHEVVWVKSGIARHGAYMVDTNGVPSIIQMDDIPYEGFYALKVTTTDGREYYYRLKCGFQWVTATYQPRTKTHVTSTTRTPSSFTTVDRCENGNKRDENGSCGSTGNGGGQPTTTKPAKPRTTKPARKDPREDVNVNPQIPRKEQVKPTQKAEPNQAQPTEPAAPATTRRENP